MGRPPDETEETSVTIAHESLIVNVGLETLLTEAGARGDTRRPLVKIIGSARELANTLALRRPEVLFVQRDFPGFDALQALATIRRRGGSCRVVVIDDRWDDDDEAGGVAAGGARAMLGLHDGEEDVLAVIDDALGTSGDRPKRPAQTPPRRPPPRRRTASGERPASVPLTAREVQVLQCIADGQTIAETARALAVSRSTVKNIRHTLYAKLNVRNSGAAVARGQALGILR